MTAPASYFDSRNPPQQSPTVALSPSRYEDLPPQPKIPVHAQSQGNGKQNEPAPTEITTLEPTRGRSTVNTLEEALATLRDQTACMRIYMDRYAAYDPKSSHTISTFAEVQRSLSSTIAHESLQASAATNLVRHPVPVPAPGRGSVCSPPALNSYCAHLKGNEFPVYQDDLGQIPIAVSVVSSHLQRHAKADPIAVEPWGVIAATRLSAPLPPLATAAPHPSSLSHRRPQSALERTREGYAGHLRHVDRDDPTFAETSLGYDYESLILMLSSPTITYVPCLPPTTAQHSPLDIARTLYATHLREENPNDPRFHKISEEFESTIRTLTLSTPGLLPRPPAPTRRPFSANSILPSSTCPLRSSNEQSECGNYIASWRSPLLQHYLSEIDHSFQQVGTTPTLCGTRPPSITPDSLQEILTQLPSSASSTAGLARASSTEQPVPDAVGPPQLALAVSPPRFGAEDDHRLEGMSSISQATLKERLKENLERIAKERHTGRENEEEERKGMQALEEMQNVQDEETKNRMHTEWKRKKEEEAGRKRREEEEARRTRKEEEEAERKQMKEEEAERKRREEERKREEEEEAERKRMKEEVEEEVERKRREEERKQKEEEEAERMCREEEQERKRKEVDAERRRKEWEEVLKRMRDEEAIWKQMVGKKKRRRKRNKSESK
ncbi:hypothetical protein BDZ91DRAFT_793565 [Kalaharituber pfeilii]|nr:hypothetical protein BDZ91DRAFT_793565 [Kalaharituber pfeilii]